ncbi:ABC transporter permease [Saccharicrinis aurantiacus]|uniref:ABC transporter permease n=1 Tax=Saccharicrinis aurantiacus TaxID=1849719 RepID=UPI00094F4FB5|nr:ABC transporter permease [Saccharicrinis aurantiacus]
MLSLKHTIRIISRNRLSFAVNSIGLTLGLTVCLLLFSYVNHELSYDKHFPNSHRIVRMLIGWQMEDGMEYIPICRRSAFTEMPSKVPEIECAYQLLRNSEANIEKDGENYGDLTLIKVDSTFFHVFGFEPTLASKQPFANENSIMLSEEMAHKIFGRIDVIGEALKLNREDFFVSAVYPDIPKNSHFKADIMVPMPNGVNKWQSLEFNTYYLIKEGVEMNTAIAKIEQANQAALDKWGAQFGIKMVSKAEPLEGMHLFTVADFDLEPIGNIKQVIMVGVIALVILLAALFNSINLFLATGQKRLKEIGIRKVSGADNKSIIKQLIAESGLINAIALIASFILAAEIMPFFSDLVNRDIPLTTLFSFKGIAMAVSVFIMSTLLAGVYPVITLVKHNTNAIFRESKNTKSSSSWLSQAMIITQLAAAVLMLFTLSGINQHLHFLQKSDLGLNPSNVIVYSGIHASLDDQLESIKQEVENIPGISKVAFSNHSMGGGYSGQMLRLNGSGEKYKDLNEYRVREDFCDLFELNLEWGRFYNANDKGNQKVVILNKTAADKLGLKPNDTRTIDMGDWRMNVEVIGVVSDFFYEGNATKVRPMAISNTGNNMNHMSVRYTPNANVNSIKDNIDTIFKCYDAQFKGYSWYNEDKFREMYVQEESIRQTVAYSGMIALFICLIGIYAITVFNLQKRLKELALRKIMGASVQAIQTLYLKKYIKQLLIAALIALPIGTIIMHEYFKNYPKHESINPLFYILSIVVPLIIICTIVAIRVLYTAKQNPVKSLRYE